MIEVMPAQLRPLLVGVVFVTAGTAPMDVTLQDQPKSIVKETTFKFVACMEIVSEAAQDYMLQLRTQLTLNVFVPLNLVITAGCAAETAVLILATLLARLLTTACTPIVWQ